jgi:transposase-like protein
LLTGRCCGIIEAIKTRYRGGVMKGKINELIELVHKMPESCLDDVLAYVEKKIAEHTEDRSVPGCPHCGGLAKRNGHKDDKQRYKCNACGKTFVETTHTAMSYSHYGEAVWKQVVRDTVDGTPLEDTASGLGLSRQTAFNMRHKILLALETEEALQPTLLDGVCEIDDTYVLESLKGTKIPEDYGRKSRKHGAIAQKPGVSNEYVCISTGIQRDGEAYCHTVTRATPSKDDITAVYNGHIGEAALALCDGAASYNALPENCGCPVVNVTVEQPGGFHHINTVNGLHSFIKETYIHYRGVATKYLNRYNALFSRVYRCGSDLADCIYNILCANDSQRHRKVCDVKALGLLDI